MQRRYKCGSNRHGLSNHKLYIVWKSMKQRCYNPKCKRYKNYGGRGIRVCIRWRRSFISFYNFCIKNGWNKNLQINRKDNDGNYTPDNCNFVTSKENGNNRRIRIDNTSEYRGVNLMKCNNKYRSYISLDGIYKHIGCYTTARQAAIARDSYIIKNNLVYQLSM